MNKSPFVIVPEFISPLMCEDIIFRLNNIEPDYDINGKPLKSIKKSELIQNRILPNLEEIIPALEQYYNYEHEGVCPFQFEWYVEGYQPESAVCENSVFTNGKWLRVNEYDFTGIIFLNDYQDKPPFDKDYEVYGGKLEFPNHEFGFNPSRGTLIIFPGCSNFANAIGEIHSGELNLVRFHLAATQLYKYDMKKFPGDYRSWFK